MSMSWELAITVGDWLQRTLGKIFFRKTRLRITYREKLKDIVYEFSPCLNRIGYPGNLEEIIGEGIKAVGKKSKYKEIADNLNFQLKQVSSLSKRFNHFSDKIDRVRLFATADLFQEFIDILSESKQIFYDFIHTLYLNLEKDEWQDVFQQLKMDTRGYPVFERIWDDTVNTLMHVSREAHKVLPEINPFETFVSLPRI